MAQWVSPALLSGRLQPGERIIWLGSDPAPCPLGICDALRGRPIRSLTGSADPIRVETLIYETLIIPKKKGVAG